MKLKKAKDLLLQNIKDPGTVYWGDLETATQIGIEAIEFVENRQASCPNLPHLILPSQTKKRPSAHPETRLGGGVSLLT